MQAPQDSFEHAIPRRGSGASIHSVDTTGSDDETWIECCQHLHDAGITTDMLRDGDLRDEIIRVLAERLISTTLPEESTGEFDDTTAIEGYEILSKQRGY